MGDVEGLDEGDGVVVEEEEGLGDGEGEAEGDGLGFKEGLGVGLTEGLAEGFGVGDGEGVGVCSGVGLGEGEAISPKISSFGGAGNKTDLTQIPDPVNIKTSKTPRDKVSFEGLF